MHLRAPKLAGDRRRAHTPYHCPQRTDTQYTIYVSFLEIYNETGYDLLDPHHDSGKLEDLPCVLQHNPPDDDALTWLRLARAMCTRTGKCR